MAYERVFKNRVDEDIKIGVFCFMAPEKVACYLQGDRVDTYPAGRRILTEYCEANREKDKAVPIDLELLQKGKDTGKGKG
eukprot:5990571-Amphidinium_carterae.1